MQRKRAKGAGKGRRPALKAVTPAKRSGKNARSSMGNLMHPHHKALIPTAIRQGDAFPIQGIVRPASVTINETKRMLFAVSNVGAAGTIMTQVIIDSVTGVTRFSYCPPLMALSDEAGGPTSARTMKAGLHLVNTSPMLNKCGRVYHLNGTARIFLPQVPNLMSTAQWNTVIDNIIGMPDANPYEGDAFAGEGKHFQCNVVDNVDYEDFVPFGGLINLEKWFEHVAVWPGMTPLPRPMSTCWIVIESPPVDFPQSYNATASATWYTRWPLNSVAGQNMRPIPTADNQVINAMHAASEMAAKVAHNPIVEGVERAVSRWSRTAGRGAGMIAGLLGR